VKTIATLQAEEAPDLSARLKTEGIPTEAREVAQAGEIQMTELLVEDGLFDRACDVSDAWQTERLTEAGKRCAWSCPKCKSRQLECVPDAKIEYLFRCKDCGHEFIPLGSPPGTTFSRPASRVQQRAVVGRDSVTLTLFILFIPVMIFVFGRCFTPSGHAIRQMLFWAWFLASIVCLERGLYILSRKRYLGWLCFAVGIIPFLVLIWVSVFHGTKSHI
jgi:hypothetical protein